MIWAQPKLSIVVISVDIEFMFDKEVLLEDLYSVPLENIRFHIFAHDSLLVV